MDQRHDVLSQISMSSQDSQKSLQWTESDSPIPSQQPVSGSVSSTDADTPTPSRRVSQSKFSDIRCAEKKTAPSRPQRPFKAKAARTSRRPVRNAKPEVVQREFTCQLCGKSYPTSTQLGGHCSRSHPGQSKSYAAKLSRRLERAPLRALLKRAQAKFRELTGKNPALHRQEVNKIRAKLAAEEKATSA